MSEEFTLEMLMGAVEEARKAHENFPVSATKKAICKSSRPLIYAGWGCTFYKKSFVRFVESVQVPVMLSWRAIDLFTGELYAGRPGIFAPPEVKDCLDDADLLLVLGARLDDMLTGYDLAKFARNAIKIVVDIDKAELDRLPEGYIKVNMDVGDFLNEM